MPIYGKSTSFKEGIGAEDIVLDAKIQRKVKLFIDPSNVMPHRRRVPSAVYLRNKCAITAILEWLGNKRWPEISR